MPNYSKSKHYHEDLQQKQMRTFHIKVLPEINHVCPNFVGAAVHAEFHNTPYSEPLWQEINRFLSEYKRCGKDPSRYRPSGEALVRRALQGKELYQIDTAVDLINLASIAYGYSIGGFDADKIQGDQLTLGIGCEGEPYEGIGRGMLNIAGLPVYRDKYGGIGTPTSDNERTKMELSTSHLLAIVNGYDGNRQNVLSCAKYIQQLLQDFAQSTGGIIVQF